MIYPIINFLFDDDNVNLWLWKKTNGTWFSVQNYVLDENDVFMYDQGTDIACDQVAFQVNECI